MPRSYSVPTCKRRDQGHVKAHARTRASSTGSFQASPTRRLPALELNGEVPLRLMTVWARHEGLALSGGNGAIPPCDQPPCGSPRRSHSRQPPLGHHGPGSTARRPRRPRRGCRRQSDTGCHWADATPSGPSDSRRPVYRRAAAVRVRVRHVVARPADIHQTRHAPRYATASGSASCTAPFSTSRVRMCMVRVGSSNCGLCADSANV
jgi:hypothetical protein